MIENLIFSKFKAQEFDSISRLLCNIFDTTSSELELLYQEIINDFGKNGWPSHFVRRDFFKSQHQNFQKIYEISPSIAIDLPSLFELDNGINDKPTIVILGQDSKSDQDSEQISLGTPYGLHHKGSREILGRTKLYFEMIVALLTLGYRVYLTDVYKVWVCDPNRPYYGVKLPRIDQEKFISNLKLEILAMSPIALVTWGKESANSVKELDLNIQHLNFPHPSGAANGTWKKLMNQSPTYKNKLAYWSSEISKVLPKSI
ncbi:hypothetical protein H6F75_07775 [Nodosilinea sp. FACHB-131]|uniref:hypothetical protein n=1 Tax=Cyanophyceae TaxID=3028117 RepID=UPI00168511A7|nr:hypothetical protein [Nodosilinea sp. FACHB-131]MBD1873377.1 hypothetical protein [Nodosilinea sp. FACHB-131]